MIDSGIAHDNAKQGAYNERRAQCDEAARRLGLASLRDATLGDVERLAPQNATLARRVRHVVTENDRVRAFVAALRAGDLARCGALVDASHASLREDFEVSIPELDALADALRAQRGVYGARLVGAGFGGSVLALADAGRAADAARAAAERFRARSGRVGHVVMPV